MKKEHYIIIISVLLILIGVILLLFNIVGGSKSLKTIKVDLTELNYTEDDETQELTKYTQDDFDSFYNAYKNGTLPNVYITEFLFDGVSMYKAYDLDDFIEDGNDVNVKVVKITVINIIDTGEYVLSGEITDAMIAVNTNDINSDIDIVLNGVKLDTNSKKVPAIYVYNKDITYTDNVVTIKTVEGTENYIEGGKLKKVSLIGSDNLDSYSNKYSGDATEWYSNYTNYYGVYTSSEIENILFATTTANQEDLQDGDPYKYYKASGAISSDIDLYFEGEGYLEVISKNKEGIETKGNLTFQGGTGDYYISAEDDCLNTTTDSSENANARNDLIIDVNSLYAIVSLDADEGDAIDSNGKLVIDGGTIIALAKPGQDAGIDSNSGIYINGGTVIATGNMYDEVKSDSNQNFMVLSFGTKVEEDDLITLLDSKGNVVFSYKTDREYTNLVYSSDELDDGTYILFKNGTIEGKEVYGFYTKVTNYEKGEQLAYSNKGSNQMGPVGNGGMGGPNGNPPDMPNGQNGNNGEPPEKPDGDTPPERPEGNDGFDPNNDDETRPEMPNGNPGEMMGNTTATNEEFVIDGIANIFSGVALYTEE